MKFYFNEILKIYRYGSIGIISAIINYLIYIIFYKFFGFEIKYSLLSGYLGGCFCSYHYGRTWVFGNGNKFNILDLLKFIITYGMGCILLNIISPKVELIVSNSSLKWLLTTSPVIMSNYLLSRYWVFKKKTE